MAAQSGGLSRVVGTPPSSAAAQQATGITQTADGVVDIGAFNRLVQALWLAFRPAVTKPTRSVIVGVQAAKAVDRNPKRVGLAIANLPSNTGNVYWGDNIGIQAALAGSKGGGSFGFPIPPGETFTFGPEDRACETYLIADSAGTEVRIAEQLAE